METPTRRFSRLLAALDDLVERESIGVEARDFAMVTELQQRAAPLVAGLAELGMAAADEVARAQVAALLARRQHSINLMESQLATAREELLALGEGTRRISQIAPVYGRAEGAAPRQNYRGRG